MPRDSPRSNDMKVDRIVISSFNNKARKHCDAGAVEEVEFPEIEHDRRR